MSTFTATLECSNCGKFEETRDIPTEIEKDNMIGQLVRRHTLKSSGNTYWTKCRPQMFLVDMKTGEKAEIPFSAALRKSICV